MHKRELSLLLCFLSAFLCFGCTDTQLPEGDETAVCSTDVTSSQVDDSFAPLTESVTTEPPVAVELPKMTENEFIAGLKDLLITAKTVEELKAAVSAFDSENRVSNMRIQQYRKGPELKEGVLSENAVAIVYFDDGLWVECEYPDALLSSREYDLYDGYNLLTSLQRMLNESESVEALLSAIDEYDVYGWITEVEVYSDIVAYKNGYRLTEGSIVDSAIIRVAYGSSSWMEVKKGSYDGR